MVHNLFKNFHFLLVDKNGNQSSLSSLIWRPEKLVSAKPNFSSDDAVAFANQPSSIPTLAAAWQWLNEMTDDLP
jgi:hypothetical protein